MGGCVDEVYPCIDPCYATTPPLRDLKISEGTNWLFPEDLASYSLIMPHGQYLILEGWAKVGDSCHGDTWDYYSYFVSTSPYTIPTALQVFEFSTGTAFDDDGHPVEFTIRGQISVD